MNEIALRAATLKTLQGAQTGTINPNAVITALRLDDGSYHVLSRYGDTVWILPDSLFAAATNDAHKRLNFSLVPLPFRETMRACIARYLLVGLEGHNRPRGRTISSFFDRVGAYLAWLHDQGIERLNHVTPLIAQQYVAICKELPGRKGDRITAETLKKRFSAVEILHLLSQQTVDPMPHPWSESSAARQAGLVGQSLPHRQAAKTDLIPDDILAPLFQSAVEWVERADEIIDLCEQVENWKAQGRSYQFITPGLRKRGWSGAELRSAEQHLQTACICIILITSGIRVSELCSLEQQCAFRTQDDHGEPFHWMRGTSYKTGAGACEWLVAELTHRAIAVAERLARPLRARLAERIAQLRADNPRDPVMTRLSGHADRIFLALSQKQNNRIGTLSGLSIVRRLNAFAAQCGLDWHFAPHQFRRTFAVYAAHSALGDLRYLRDHFKHWSLDMTSLYAMNRLQDAELYDELGLAALNIKTDLLEHWLEPDAILTGGAADPIRAFRAKNEAVTTKDDRAEMAKTLSPLIHLRATGVAWCTADTGGCNGGQGVDKTRCGDCGNAVIDESRKPVWQGIYAQQLELLDLTDIGPGGRERVERDIARCKSVLKDLGATTEDLADVAT